MFDLIRALFFWRILDSHHKLFWELHALITSSPIILTANWQFWVQAVSIKLSAGVTMFTDVVARKRSA
jgi:hypothetical protein